MVSVFLFGVALGDEERGTSASSAARKTDFCGCNSPLAGETRSDCPLNESESRPRAPTTKFNPCFAAGNGTTAGVGVPLRCDTVFTGLVPANAVAARSARQKPINELRTV